MRQTVQSPEFIQEKNSLDDSIYVPSQKNRNVFDKQLYKSYSQLSNLDHKKKKNNSILNTQKKNQGRSLDEEFVLKQTKRRGWTQQQDEIIQQLAYNKSYKNINFNEISEKMKQMGCSKSVKQCRDRWINHLNPNLIKNKWNQDQNHHLMDLHNQYGNKWKQISEHFVGRTDAQIKNQFFSIVRKGLRTASKCIEDTTDASIYSVIKPKVLANFSLQKRKIKIPKNLLKSKEKQIKTVNLSQLIQKYYFGNQRQLKQQITSQEIYIIKNVIEYIKQMNKKYNLRKQKKIKKMDKQKVANFQKLKIKKYTKKEKLTQSVCAQQNQNVLKKINKTQKLFNELTQMQKIFKNFFPSQDFLLLKEKQEEIIAHLLKQKKLCKNLIDFIKEIQILVNNTNENLNNFVNKQNADQQQNLDNQKKADTAQLVSFIQEPKISIMKLKSETYNTNHDLLNKNYLAPFSKQTEPLEKNLCYFRHKTKETDQLPCNKIFGLNKEFKQCNSCIIDKKQSFIEKDVEQILQSKRDLLIKKGRKQDQQTKKEVLNNKKIQSNMQD